MTGPVTCSILFNSCEVSRGQGRTITPARRPSRHLPRDRALPPKFLVAWVSDVSALPVASAPTPRPGMKTVADGGLPWRQHGSVHRGCTSRDRPSPPAAPGASFSRPRRLHAARSRPLPQAAPPTVGSHPPPQRHTVPRRRRRGGRPHSPWRLKRLASAAVPPATRRRKVATASCRGLLTSIMDEGNQ